MWPLGVVELNPVADYTAGVLLGLEPMSMHALLFQCPDDPFHHAVLLRAMRRDEFLFQTVAAHQAGEGATGEDQTVVRAQQEGYRYSTQCAEAGNQGLLQRRLRRGGLATTRQVPAQQFPGMAVHHQRQTQPAVMATPDAAQVG